MSTSQVVPSVKATALPSLSVLVILSAVGCATAPIAPSTETTVVPVTRWLIEPLAADSTSQSKGGITISVSPGKFSTVYDTLVTYSPVEPSFQQKLFPGEGISPETHTFAERRATPQPRLVPAFVRLDITIANHMQRVFRGHEAIIKFQVGSKDIPTAPAAYQALLDATITPGDESRLTIQGPFLENLADSATLTLSMYDVVTDIDVAGDVAEKQNFDWQFTVKREPIRRDVTVTTQTGWFPNADVSRHQIVKRTQAGPLS